MITFLVQLFDKYQQFSSYNLSLIDNYSTNGTLIQGIITERQYQQFLTDFRIYPYVSSLDIHKIFKSFDELYDLSIEIEKEFLFTVEGNNLPNNETANKKNEQSLAPQAATRRSPLYIDFYQFVDSILRICDIFFMNPSVTSPSHHITAKHKFSHKSHSNSSTKHPPVKFLPKCLQHYNFNSMYNTNVIIPDDLISKMERDEKFELFISNYLLGPENKIFQKLLAPPQDSKDSTISENLDSVTEFYEEEKESKLNLILFDPTDPKIMQKIPIIKGVVPKRGEAQGKYAITIFGQNIDRRKTGNIYVELGGLDENDPEISSPNQTQKHEAEIMENEETDTEKPKNSRIKAKKHEASNKNVLLRAENLREAKNLREYSHTKFDNVLKAIEIVKIDHNVPIKKNSVVAIEKLDSLAGFDFMKKNLQDHDPFLGKKKKFGIVVAAQEVYFDRVVVEVPSVEVTGHKLMAKVEFERIEVKEKGFTRLQCFKVFVMRECDIRVSCSNDGENFSPNFGKFLDFFQFS